MHIHVLCMYMYIGVILPGRNLTLDFIFKSPNSGIFSETWEIVTRPVLLSNNGQSPLYVTLKGVSFQPDLHQEKRAMIEVCMYMYIYIMCMYMYMHVCLFLFHFCFFFVPLSLSLSLSLHVHVSRECYIMMLLRLHQRE